MAELLSYAGPSAKRKRRIPPDALVGMAVGSLTLFTNLVLTSAFIRALGEADSRNAPVYGAAIAGVEAVLSCLIGAVLIIAAVCVWLASPWAARLHRIYAWGKIGLTVGALVTYTLLPGRVWRSLDVKLILCALTGLGAIYPLFVLLALRRVAAEDVTGALQ